MRPSDHGSLPEFITGDVIDYPWTEGKRALKAVELTCPRKKCNGRFIVIRKDLRASCFLSRACPHCFRTAMLPPSLIRYIKLRKPGQPAT